MAKQTAVAEKQLGMWSRMTNFLNDVNNEAVNKVAWPTMDELRASTKITMYMLLILAAIIFVYDQIFSVFILALLSLVG